jgi:AraC-like DNA-binding protein
MKEAQPMNLLFAIIPFLFEDASKMTYEFIKHIEGTMLKTFVVTINHRELHFHSDMEILMVLKGSVVINDLNTRHLLEKNDIFIINRNQLHSLSCTNEPNLLMVIQFDLGFCKKYYPKIGRIFFTQGHIKKQNSFECWKTLKQSMIDIITCHTEKKEGYALQMMSILNHLLFAMLNQESHIELDEAAAASRSRITKRLGRIIEYISENFMNQITLQSIAEQNNLNMYYLSHFIKTHLGMSFRDYLNRVRFEHAELLLISTDLSNIDICLECGFSDYKYLKKAFRAEYGCTPDEFRKKAKRVQTHVEENSEQHIIMEAGKALKEISK